MRIWKVLGVSAESKAWIADPNNRVCDAPGSWYCKGQYPPKLGKLMKKKRDFSQLEDFNKKKDAKSKKYTEQYLARMEGRAVSDDDPDEAGGAAAAAAFDPKNVPWEDSDATTQLWQIISDGKTSALKSLLEQEPRAALLRASDGRGPLFWAHEYGQTKMVDLLVKAGADPEARGKNKKKPAWTS